MRILLTGAGGFLGARFATMAVAEGHYVLGVGRNTRPPRLVELRKQSKFSYQIMDAGDSEALVTRARTFQPAVVVHMAAVGVTKSDQIPTQELLRSHFQCAIGVAAAAQETSAAVVWVGCASEYSPSDVPVSETAPTEPVSPFGVAKNVAWRTFQRMAVGRVRTTALRPFYLYGPGDRDERFPRMVMRAALGRGPNQLGEPHLIRDLVFVDDVVRAVLQACETTRLQSPDHLPIVNLGTGRGISQAALARAISVAVNASTFEPGFGPSPTPHDTDPPYLVARMHAAERLLGWKATTGLEAGLAQVFADFQAQT